MGPASRFACAGRRRWISDSSELGVDAHGSPPTGRGRAQGGAGLVLNALAPEAVDPNRDRRGALPIRGGRLCTDEAELITVASGVADVAEGAEAIRVFWSVV